MMPPTDIEPKDLWRRLQERPRPSDIVDYPDPSMGQIRIQVLTSSEHDEARTRAYQQVSGKLSREDMAQGVIQEGVYADAVARECLAMACVTVKPVNPDSERPTYARIFPDGPSIGKALPPNEVAALFMCYEMVQNRVGPTEQSVYSKEDVTSWILRLGKGAAAYPLSRLRWLRLVDLTTSVSERARELSELLESHLSTLPAGLVASLANLDIGTGYFGQPPATTADFTTSSPIASDLQTGVTMTEAARLAEIIRNENQ